MAEIQLEVPKRIGCLRIFPVAYLKYFLTIFRFPAEGSPDCGRNYFLRGRLPCRAGGYCIVGWDAIFDSIRLLSAFNYLIDEFQPQKNGNLPSSQTQPVFPVPSFKIYQLCAGRFRASFALLCRAFARRKFPTAKRAVFIHFLWDIFSYLSQPVSFFRI